MKKLGLAGLFVIVSCVFSNINAMINQGKETDNQNKQIVLYNNLENNNPEKNALELKNQISTKINSLKNLLKKIETDQELTSAEKESQIKTAIAFYLTNQKAELNNQIEKLTKEQKEILTEFINQLKKTATYENTITIKDTFCKILLNLTSVSFIISVATVISIYMITTVISSGALNQTIEKMTNLCKWISACGGVVSLIKVLGLLSNVSSFTGWLF